MNRLTQLNQLGPGGVVQVHLLQEFVGHSLQCILGPHLFTAEQSSSHDHARQGSGHKQHHEAQHHEINNRRLLNRFVEATQQLYFSTAANLD